MKTDRNLPDGWEWKQLDEVCEIRKGSSITKKKIGEGDIPVVAGGKEPAYFHDKSNRNGETITVSASGAYAGYVNYFIQPIFASDCSTIKPINCGDLLPSFVYKMLKSRQNEIYNLQKGGGQPHVYPKDLKGFKIPVPPVDTQRKIIDILDSMEELQHLRKETLGISDQLIQSVFLEMFGDPKKNPKGWVTILLKECIENVRYGTSSPPTFSESGIPFIRATNIKKGRILEKNMKYIPESESHKIEKCKLDQNDILIVRSGVNTGDCALVGEKYSSAYAGYDLILNPNSNKLNEFYLVQLLYSQYYQKILLMLSRRAGQPHINSKQVKELQIPLPPVHLQQQFADFVQSVEDMKSSQLKSAETMDEMFNSFLDKAFRGELVC
ncbi:restriction endonuclease subunit S [Methanohalophilus sp. RSK]|uniref:restriction endonuclease subunit S n=1 Tax=Methanohalophilus sp. RSK TaxID=2485783 RepID=UPI000F43938E|nr:restriction endonuclease subunit S [Methanohalophilus sp. RSK]RNI14525.1 restriction endonuclease subunit S [Methanohalophilus sp. RSK]